MTGSARVANASNVSAGPLTEAVSQKTLDAMERWVRWRSGVGYDDGTGGRPVGGSGNLLGRLQGGKRQKVCPICEGKKRVPVPGQLIKRRCPTCDGVGTVPEDLQAIERMRFVPCDGCMVNGKPTGEVDGRTCFTCRGSGERLEAELYVHPAMIPGTRIYGKQDPDPVSALINRTVVHWKHANVTYWWHRVVMEYYDPDGRTQEQKAARMGVSSSWFSKNLKQAHLRIQELLKTGV